MDRTLAPHASKWRVDRREHSVIRPTFRNALTLVKHASMPYQYM